MCVVTALTLTLGAHWILLQSVAWMGMVVTYSQTDSLTVAISKTFDGQHPCKICKVVRKGQQASEKQETVKVEKQIDSFLIPASTRIPEPPAFEVATSTLAHFADRFDPPASPPPRRA